MEAATLPIHKTSSKNALHRAEREFTRTYSYAHHASQGLSEKPSFADFKNASMVANSYFKDGRISEEALNKFLEVLLASFTEMYIYDKVSSCVDQRLQLLRQLIMRQIMG
jgi:hypothetical protein